MDLAGPSVIPRSQSPTSEPRKGHALSGHHCLQHTPLRNPWDVTGDRTTSARMCRDRDLTETKDGREGPGQSFHAASPLKAKSFHNEKDFIFKISLPLWVGPGEGGICLSLKGVKYRAETWLEGSVSSPRSHAPREGTWLARQRKGRASV